jgi:hypothetical protein
MYDKVSLIESKNSLMIHDAPYLTRHKMIFSSSCKIMHISLSYKVGHYVTSHVITYPTYHNDGLLDMMYYIIGKFCQAYLWKREGRMNRRKSHPRLHTGTGEGIPDIPGRVHHHQTTPLIIAPSLSRPGSTTMLVGTPPPATGSGNHNNNNNMAASNNNNLGTGHTNTSFHGTSSPHSNPTAIIIPLSPQPSSANTITTHATATVTTNSNQLGVVSLGGNGHVSVPSSPNPAPPASPLHPPHHPPTALHPSHISSTGGHVSPPNLTVTLAPPPQSPVPPSVITAGGHIPSRPSSATGMRSASAAAGGAVMATKHLTIGSVALTRMDSPTSSPSVGSGVIAGSLHHQHNNSYSTTTGSRQLFANATAAAAASAAAAATVANTQPIPVLSAASSSSPTHHSLATPLLPAVATPSAGTVAISPSNANGSNNGPPSALRLSSLAPLPDITRSSRSSRGTAGNPESPTHTLDR